MGGARMLRGLSAHLQRVAPREERRVLRREAAHDSVQARPEPLGADGRACRVVGTREWVDATAASPGPSRARHTW